MFSRMRSLQAAAGLRRPISLTVSPRIDDVMAIGRSEICISRNLLPDLEVSEQESALAHEIAHLRRRDPLWAMGAQALSVLFFFQPLHRWVAHRLQEEAEYICDEWAVRRTGNASAMARSLVKVALLREREAPVMAAASGMAAREATLMRRARRILARGRPAKPRALSRATAVLVPLVLLTLIGVAPRAVVGEGNRPSAACLPGSEVLPFRAKPCLMAHRPLAPGDGFGGARRLAIECLAGEEERRLELSRIPEGGFESRYFVNGEEQPFDERAVDLLLDLMATTGIARGEPVLEPPLPPVPDPPNPIARIARQVCSLPAKLNMWIVSGARDPGAGHAGSWQERQLILERAGQMPPEDVPAFLRDLPDGAHE
jgi:hypothetical protein